VLGTDGQGKDAISTGLWTFDANLRDGLLRKADITANRLEAWYGAAFRDAKGRFSDHSAANDPSAPECEGVLQPMTA